MGFSARATVAFWKSETCFRCGGQYQYKITRKVSAGGATESEAVSQAKRLAGSKARSGSDVRPCPHCGCVQPIMIGHAKAWVHGIAAGVLSIPCIVVLLIAINSHSTWMQYSRASAVLSCLAAFALLVHVAAVAWNPNRDRRANLRRADRLIARGVMREGKAGPPDAVQREPAATGRGSTVWLVSAAVSWLLVLSPVLAKLVTGSASNSLVKPDVVSPGDTVRVFFETEINAINSQWRGTPRATVTLGQLDIPIPATASQNSWNGGMSVKRSARGGRTTSLWADLAIPNAPALAGRTLAIRITMPVEYPSPGEGLNTFVTRSTLVNTTQTIRLSSTGAGHAYWLTYLLCVLGCITFAVSGVGLAVTADGIGKGQVGRPARQRDGRRSSATEDDDDAEDDQPPPTRRGRPPRQDTSADGWRN